MPSVELYFEKKQILVVETEIRDPLIYRHEGFLAQGADTLRPPEAMNHVVWHINGILDKFRSMLATFFPRPPSWI